MLWNVETGVEIRRLCGHTTYVWGLAEIALGAGRPSCLASVSADKSVRVWCTESRRCDFGECISVAAEEHRDSVYCIGQLEHRTNPLPTERLLEGTGGLKGATKQSIKDPLDALACCSLPLLTCALLMTSLHSEAALPPFPPGTLMNNGRTAPVLMATGSADMQIHIWNVSKAHVGAAGTIRTLRGHRGAVSSVVGLGPALLASAADDKTVRIWNPLSNAAALHVLPTGRSEIGQLSVTPFLLRISARGHCWGVTCLPALAFC